MTIKFKRRETHHIKNTLEEFGRKRIATYEPTIQWEHASEVANHKINDKKSAYIKF